MVNDLLSVWSTVGSVLLAILILLVMITIHELGHYIAGKILHFKIDEFSIGFGPAVFKHKSKRTDELFAIRIIPLGGYCAFAGEDGLEEEKDKKENKDAEKENGEPPFAESAAEETKPSEAAAADDSAESAAEETKLPEAAAEEPAAPAAPAAPADTSGYFTNRPCWARIIVLVAGALMNYLLALVLIVVGFLAYGQTMVAVYRMEEATGEYAAYSLQDLDILLQAEGKNLYLTSDIAQALNGKKQGDIVRLRVSRAYGLEWKEDGNGGTRPTFVRREEIDVDVMLRSDVTVKNSADFTSVWDALGVKYEQGETEEGGYFLANAVYRFGFWEGLGRAFVYSFKIAGSIFKVIGELLTGKLGLSAFGGPVTTIKMTSEIASRGFRYFLEIAGYIGVNLAVFNLLPIPALDGSKVVFTAIEWVRGKPISRKVEAIIHAVGFVLLLGFAVLVDILQFVL